jgi:hypothetical protein
MSDPLAATDSEVLRLRGTGQAFARISRDLGLARAVDAQQAFQRAVRQLPAGERDRVCREEGSRLDRLAAQVNADSSLSVEDRDRRLAGVERLRAWMLDGD